MVLSRILHALFGPISAHQFQHIHFLIRKSTHFGSYGLLSALAFFSWRATLPARALWTFRWSALALLLTVTAAGLDEFHQSFLPSRTSSLRDVFLDLAGAIFFQLVILLWLRWRQARKSQ
jgi:VanZ family protein